MLASAVARSIRIARSVCPGEPAAASPFSRSDSTAISNAVRARRASPSLATAQWARASSADLEVQLAVAVFFVGDGSLQQGGDVFFAEGLEVEHLAAADQGAVDGVAGVFGGGADEADDAALDVAQQHVLLGFVEAVDFVEEEDGAAVVLLQPLAGGVEHEADVFDADGGGVAAVEVRVGVVGDEFGEGGFAGARRAVKQHAAHAVGVDHAAQQGAGAQKVALAGEGVERARTHAGGEGLGAVAVFFLLGLPEGHGHPAGESGKWMVSVTPGASGEKRTSEGMTGMFRVGAVAATPPAF